MIALELEVLGFDIDFIARGKVAAMVASTPPARSGTNGITLVGHVDTALRGGGEITLQDEWSTAIGVGDDKGGVMVGLRALEKLGRNLITDLPLRFILSPNEESGSPGFHEVFAEISTQSNWVLGLGPIAKGMHTLQEAILTRTLETRSSPWTPPKSPNDGVVGSCEPITNALIGSCRPCTSTRAISFIWMRSPRNAVSSSSASNSFKRNIPLG